LFATYQTSTAISLFALATTLVSLVTLRFLKDKAGMLDQG
jgi:hypothetical protein